MKHLIITLCCVFLWTTFSTQSHAAQKIRFSPKSGVNKPITSKHLGIRFSTKTKDYTESWILWAWDKRGYTIYSLMVITRIFLGTRFGVMTTVRTPKGKIYHRMVEYKRKDIRWQKGKFVLYVANKHSLKGTPKKGKITVRHKDIGFKLKFTRTLDGFRPQGGPILFGKYSFNGITYAPRLKVKGKLRVGKKTIDFNGMGYADHSWQDIMPPKMARRWYGARGFHKNYTVIATHLQSAKAWKPADVPGISIAKGDKWLFHGAQHQVKYKEDMTKRDPVTGYYPPRRVTYTGKIPDGRDFKVIITHTKLYDRMDVLAQFNIILRFIIQRLITKPFLFRYKSNFDLTFSKNGKVIEHISMPGFAEWAYINP